MLRRRDGFSTMPGWSSSGSTGAFEMATITKTNHRRDKTVQALEAALEEYERQHPRAKATLYRDSPGSVRVRIVDDRFARMKKFERHDEVYDFLVERVGVDVVGEVSILLLFTRAELKTSLANLDFEETVPLESLHD